MGRIVINNLGAIAALALVSTVALTSSAFAEWTVVGQSVDGDIFYIDYSTVKENKGYVYYWALNDYLEPTDKGRLSHKILRKLDCGIPRRRQYLSYIFYNQPMGGGNSATKSLSGEWEHPVPNSVDEVMADLVCEYAGK
jgi:hypothetical protein